MVELRETLANHPLGSNIKKLYQKINPYEYTSAKLHPYAMIEMTAFKLPNKYNAIPSLSFFRPAPEAKDHNSLATPRKLTYLIKNANS